MVIIRSQRWQYLLFALFAFSGFSGLIYESVWSNYLKFFLGHAAYAQALVLVIFMGGMAMGAWFSGRWISRLSNPLMVYAIVELIIGVFGLLFHRVFVGTTGFMLDTLLPNMTSPWAIDMVRWGLASALILPQTILLGATFPLMTTGILRCFPDAPGSSISMLYFTNSMGAVIGVLVSGFLLIDLIGLPGTVMTSAIVNFLLAIFVYVISKKLAVEKATPVLADKVSPVLLRPLLWVALITGLSSFIYEISWIRMLSLVLGASTHSFELMLSAFILGLALGGFWIRKRIDLFTSPLIALAIIQLVMGLMALSTVVSYNQMFDLMRAFMSMLQRNEEGYVFFNLASHFIAMLIMLPVTFMAGMTLPLITYVLFQKGAGESAIGKVYAFNTFGAIIGVCLASQLLLPLLGLKAAVIIGAVFDIVLGVYLLSNKRVSRVWQPIIWIGSIASVVVVTWFVDFDVNRMGSGVFRHGNIEHLNDFKILYRKDGRTATVAVFENREGIVTISTNGKPDASANMNITGVRQTDEPTMILTGGLPLLVKPDAETAAVIGIGSGMSANVLLTSPTIKSVDVIEIEEGMVDGARFFGHFSELIFNDPRAHIQLDDAKSFFATKRKTYDVIISEPSNPWVSGVSSLFTEEFYARIQRHLNEDGILIQWLHMYETNPMIVESIVKALNPHFSDYRLYAANTMDFVFVASKNGKVPLLDDAMFSEPGFKDIFAHVSWMNLDDVKLHEIGSRHFLDPLFYSTGAPANSDYFPFVDQHAVKARFKDEKFKELVNLPTVGIPMPGINFYGDIKSSEDELPILFIARRHSQYAQKLARYYAGDMTENVPATSLQLHEALMILNATPTCNSEVEQKIWREKLVYFSSMTIPYLTEDEVKPVFAYFDSRICDSKEAEKTKDLLGIIVSLSQRNMPVLEKQAKIWFHGKNLHNDAVNSYVMDALLLSLFVQEKYSDLYNIVSIYKGDPTTLTRFFYLHALAKI